MKQTLIIISLLLLAVCPLWSQTITPVDETPLAGDTVPAAPSESRAVPGTPVKTTPVDIDDEKPTVVLHYYDKHGEPLKEPVRFVATLDTVTKPKSKPIYPLYNGMNIGVNFGDAIFQAFGQDYGSYDIWANVSLHNWFFPTLELGVGFANDRPHSGNFTYKVKPSFYAKLGINYNFLYKSNPDYQLFFGLRCGFSSFSYDLKNVDITNDYWGEHQTMDLDGLKSTCVFGEALMGIQVKIVKNFSLGWTARWHFRMSDGEDNYSKPWFVPGYGGTSPLAVTVSAIYTFGRKPPREDPAAAQNK